MRPPPKGGVTELCTALHFSPPADPARNVPDLLASWRRLPDRRCDCHRLVVLRAFSHTAARSRQPSATRGRSVASAGRRARGPGLAMERGREEQQGPRTSSRKEHVMMFAFALALVGVVVLGSLELVAVHAHAAAAHRRPPTRRETEHAMTHDFLSIYPAKLMEYGLAIGYLLLFIPFWRYVQGGKRAAAEPRTAPGARRRGRGARPTRAPGRRHRAPAHRGLVPRPARRPPPPRAHLGAARDGRPRDGRHRRLRAQARRPAAVELPALGDAASRRASRRWRSATAAARCRCSRRSTGRSSP